MLILYLSAYSYGEKVNLKVQFYKLPVIFTEDKPLQSWRQKCFWKACYNIAIYNVVQREAMLYKERSPVHSIRPILENYCTS